MATAKDIDTIKLLANIHTRQKGLVKLADYLMEQYDYLTIRDNSERILVYNTDIGIWEKYGNLHIKEKAHKFCQDLTKNAIKELLDKIRARTYFKRERFNPPNLLCVRNGVLNLDTRELLPHSKDYYLTRRLDVDYLPTVECPTIDNFLDTNVGKEKKNVLYEAIGYGFLQNYKYHKLFFLYGKTHTGKSTFIDLLKTFYGKGNYSSLTLYQISNKNFTQQKLYGKFANFSPDLPPTRLRNSGLLKALTGGDSIEGDVKFGKLLQFDNTAKLWFQANELPTTAFDDDDAFFVRCCIIDFNKVFLGSTADRNLIKKLTTDQELSGLLNKALDGIDRLEARESFDEIVNIHSIRNNWFERSDSTIAYYRNNVTIVNKNYHLKDDVYANYQEWCLNTGKMAKDKTELTKTLKYQSNGMIQPTKVSIDKQQTPAYSNIKIDKLEDYYKK